MKCWVAIRESIVGGLGLLHEVLTLLAEVAKLLARSWRCTVRPHPGAAQQDLRRVVK